MRAYSAFHRGPLPDGPEFDATVTHLPPPSSTPVFQGGTSTVASLNASGVAVRAHNVRLRPKSATLRFSGTKPTVPMELPAETKESRLHAALRDVSWMSIECIDRRLPVRNHPQPSAERSAPSTRPHSVMEDASVPRAASGRPPRPHSAMDTLRRTPTPTSLPADSPALPDESGSRKGALPVSRFVEIESAMSRALAVAYTPAAKLDVCRRGFLDYISECAPADYGFFLRCILEHYDAAVDTARDAQEIQRLTERALEAEEGKRAVELRMKEAQSAMMAQRLDVDLLRRRIIAMEDHLQHLSIVHHVPLKSFGPLGVGDAPAASRKQTIRDTRTETQKLATAGISSTPLSFIVSKNESRWEAAEDAQSPTEATPDVSAMKPPAVESAVDDRVRDAYLRVRGDATADAVELLEEDLIEGSSQGGDVDDSRGGF